MMAKFRMALNLSIGQGTLLLAMQSGLSAANGPPIQNPSGSIMQLATKLPDQTHEGMHGYGKIVHVQAVKTPQCR